MTRQIRASQLCWLLMAGRLSSCLLRTGEDFRVQNLWELLLALLLNVAVLAAVWLPSWLAYRRGVVPGGKWLRVGYGLLALFVLYLDLLQFSAFAKATVTADFSAFLLTAVLAVIGLLAAAYGLEAVARSAAVIAVVSLVVLLVFTALLIPYMRALHFPIVSVSATRVLSGALRELPRTAEIAVLWVLYPHVSGKSGSAYAWFVGVTSLLTAAICVVTSGVLGDAAGEMTYPFYTAVLAVTPYAELLAITVWLGTFFVRTALFGTVYAEQVRYVLGQRAVWAAVGIAAAVLMTVTWLTLGRSGFWWLLTTVYASALFLFAVVIPLFVMRRGVKR